MAIVTISGIPVYDALILDEESGMMRISLVDDPAVMSNFQAFDNKKKLLMYSVTDDEKRLVRGVIMRADFPIYRRDEKMGEYYILYKADTIRQMAEKYLVENRQNNFNLMHEEGSDVEGIQMVQFFIKDSAAGIDPEGFDVADGTLFGEFHVINDEVWQQVKDGTFKGFSLEGVFDLTPEQDKKDVQEIVDSLDGKFNRIFKTNSNSKNMSKLSRLKAALAKALAEFGNITTDRGILGWDGEEDLKEGDSVFIEDAEGNRTPAEDGDYRTEDNKVIVVVEGKVAEIKDPESEVSTVSEDMGKIPTDKGDLLWEGEEDLKEGVSVFVEKDGENVPAEDGDYTTEDGKVIKVADGKVESITDDSAEVSTNLKAKRQTLFSKVKEAFSDSYNDKMKKISDAIVMAGFNGYVCDAGDDFAIISCWNDLTYTSHYYRFSLTWDAEGNPVIGEAEEVKPGYLPVDENSASATESAPSEEAFNALKAENDSLKKEVEKLKKTPAAKPAHEVVETSQEFKQTGHKGIDRLSKILSAK